jgi:YfiH family protein
MVTAMIECIRPDWTAPATVRACSTTRDGGVSAGPWRSLNLAAHVGDDPRAVEENRARLSDQLGLPGPPQWLDQVHGTGLRLRGGGTRCADACLEDRPGRVCVVLTADCLPVLICNGAGTQVAAVHAGWRGLLAGVLERAVAAFDDEPGQLLAWLGPAIGPQVFEVGGEVRAGFLAEDVGSEPHFAPRRGGRWLADLYGLARLRLERRGVRRVTGGEWCTLSEPARFFSYRRDGVTGRMASLIWLQP